MIAGVRYLGTRPEQVEGHAYAVPPSKDRVVVEVLNATAITGLARVGARQLRANGIDVVFLATSAPSDSTRILVRRGELEAGNGSGRRWVWDQYGPSVTRRATWM